jgi:hypothetical protein
MSSFSNHVTCSLLLVAKYCNSFFSKHNTMPLKACPRPSSALLRARTPLASVSGRGSQSLQPHVFERHSSVNNPTPSQPPPPPARWNSNLKERLGKCIIFGCSPSQVQRAAGVLRILATEWRSLTAGSEGFVTGGRRGLEGQAVVWGEMDSFVSCAGPS